MASAVIGGVATVAKQLWGFVYPKIKSTIKFRSNLECLRKEMENLMTIVQSVKEQTEAAEKGGCEPALQVPKWLKDCEEIKGKMDLLEEKIEAKDKKMMKFSPHPRLGSKVAKYLIKVNRLVEVGKFPSGLVIENFKVGKVQHIPGPSIVHQSTASKNLKKVLDLLNDNNVSTIGVWGMGGVGKTTLVKNLNNKLEASDSGANFSIIMWATASKNADLRSLQSQLVQRLNLDKKRGESMESTASRLHQRLKQEKRFLFILDDVWEKIDLYYLGFSELDIGNKVILTTRSMDVCRQMKTDIEVRVQVLSEDESWQLFIKNTGKRNVNCDNIEPIARKICLECKGLPLAINVVGASMRGKTNVTLLEVALNALQKSVPCDKGVEEEVYKPLKWSYDSLFFHNMNVKSCFLYCCLYPEDFSININELVNCWIGEGLVDESDSYQGMVDIGTSMVEYLKDCCLLEDGIGRDTVRMHDVVRDVAIRIASDSENECKSLVSSESCTKVAFRENYRRISLIGCLPNFSKQYPEVLSLLLHVGTLSEIPEEYFQKFPALRVLKLKNKTHNCRPFFIEHLSELRTLLARNVHTLPTLGDLYLLQVLDFSHGNLSTFPEGMEKLTNLRQLILVETKLFQIREGVISKLIRLEILDMTGSLYKWDADGEGRTPFNELQCLQRLSFLSIRIKMSSSSTTDFSWLGRVKRFHLKVGEQEHWYCKESYARSVIVCRNELGGEGFRSLLQIASHVVLDRCYCVERLWSDLDKGYSFRALKSLTIVKSITEFDLSRVSSQFDLLPNLEKLFVDNVDTIESVSQLMQFLGSRFLKLRVLSVTVCNRLRYLFTSSDVVPTLESLEKVTVMSCDSFLELYENSASANQKLKAIKLYDLPEFSTLFGQQESWEQLEQLEVMGCKRINRIPFTAQSASNLKEIKGESEWWNKLEWDDENSSMSLHSYFKPSTYPTELHSDYKWDLGPIRELCTRGAHVVQMGKLDLIYVQTQVVNAIFLLTHFIGDRFCDL